MAQDLVDATELQQKIRAGLESLNPEHRFGKFNTHVPCRILTCVGTIVLDRSRKYLGDPTRFLIGPGGRDQMTDVEEYYCSSCCISYHHLPELPRGELIKMG